MNEEATNIAQQDDDPSSYAKRKYNPKILRDGFRFAPPVTPQSVAWKSVNNEEKTEPTPSRIQVRTYLDQKTTRQVV
jgi:hypothetical protein